MVPDPVPSPPAPVAPPESGTRWSPWRLLPAAFAPDAGSLAETLDGGQAFRWNTGDGVAWRGAWGGCLAEVRPARVRGLEWRAPREVAAGTEAAVERYFACDQPWEEWVDRLPWRSDAHLARCIAGCPGLRLLRQPFGETLLGFLCSATKQIVQIKQMLELLAARLGRPIAAGAPRNRLPTWEELAKVTEAELRECLLGFRARHIAAVARFLAAQPGWLEETEALPYGEARERLCGLPGVGEKVADCVLLFGAGRLEAFPVDVWILRSLAEHYGLEGWKPEQVAQFGRSHFGPHAGLAQQFLFAWERKHGGRRRPAVTGTRVLPGSPTSQ
jgi:N-glycosylase/DNA lyase